MFHNLRLRGAVLCHRIWSLPAFRTWNTDIRPRLCTSEHKPKWATAKLKLGHEGSKQASNP